jgi:hypothetical protein
MPITAAPVLVLLVCAVVLLLPDVSSVEIPGIVRIENQIKEQANRQEELLRLVQNINVSQAQYMFFGLQEIADMLNRQPEKRQDFESDDA